MMTAEKARQVAANVLTEGVATKHMLSVVREAHTVLFLESLFFKDSRPENGAMLILESHIDRMTTQTSGRN